MAQKKRKGNRWLWFLLTLTILAVAGAVMAKQMGWIGKTAFTKVATEQVKKRNIIETVSANGKIYPETEVAIAPDVSGEIVKITVEEGDSVKQGQLLVSINPEVYEAFVDRADAAVKTAKANKANTEARKLQLQVQIDNARRIYDRNKQLFADQVIAEVELETAETSFKNLEAELLALEKNIEASQYNVESARASLKEAKDNLRRTNLYAPINGVVSKLSVEEGERVVGTSQFAGTEIIRIANFNSMEVRVDVSENDIVRVALNDTALVSIDAYNEREFKGLVTQIANSANSENLLSTDQITNFTVKIRLLRSSYQDLQAQQRFPFRPGMSAAVDIQTNMVSNVVSVPLQAVTAREIPDSLRENNNTNDELEEIVFVVNDGKVLKRKVSIGLQDDTYIEIKNGVNAKDEVVVAPYSTINRVLEDSIDVQVVDKEELYKKEDN